MTEILNLIAEARRAAFDHRFDDAARHATAVLDRLPTCLVALRILAWAQLELDDDAAQTTFAQCAEYDPEDALAHVGQALWYERHEQNDVALRHWVRAWELDPQNQAIRRGLVKLSGELPDSAFADAIGHLRDGRCHDAVQAMQELRGDVAVDSALMTALWSAGAHRQAFDLALAVHTQHPRNAKAALFVAALEDRNGRTLRSREAIARAEQIDPGLHLFGDVVRQVGLQTALDLHRASRAPLAAAR